MLPLPYPVLPCDRTNVTAAGSLGDDHTPVDSQRQSSTQHSPAFVELAGCSKAVHREPELPIGPAGTKARQHQAPHPSTPPRAHSSDLNAPTAVSVRKLKLPLYHVWRHGGQLACKEPSRASVTRCSPSQLVRRPDNAPPSVGRALAFLLTRRLTSSASLFPPPPPSPHSLTFSQLKATNPRIPASTVFLHSASYFTQKSQHLNRNHGHCQALPQDRCHRR